MRTVFLGCLFFMLAACDGESEKSYFPYSVKARISGLGEGASVVVNANGADHGPYSDGYFSFDTKYREFKLSISSASADDIRCDFSPQTGTFKDARKIIQINCYRALLLLSASVENGDTGVSRVDDIQLKFNRAIDGDTLQGIELREKDSGELVERVVETSVSGSIVIRQRRPEDSDRPAGTHRALLKPLARDADYVLRIPKTLRSVAIYDFPQRSARLDEDIAISFHTENARRWRSTATDELPLRVVVGALDNETNDYVLYTTNEGLFATPYDVETGRWDVAPPIQLLTATDLAMPVDGWWRDYSRSFHAVPLSDTRVLITLFVGGNVIWREIGLSDGTTIASGSFPEMSTGTSSVWTANYAASPDRSRVLFNFAITTARDLTCRPYGFVHDVSICMKQDIWEVEWNGETKMAAAKRLYHDLTVYGSAPSELAIANDGTAYRLSLVTAEMSGQIALRPEHWLRLGANGTWQPDMRFHPNDVIGFRAGRPFASAIDNRIDIFSSGWSDGRAWLSSNFLLDGETGNHGAESRTSETLHGFGPYLTDKDVDLLFVAAGNDGFEVFSRRRGGEWTSGELIAALADASPELKLGVNYLTGDKEWAVLGDFITDGGYVQGPGLWTAPVDGESSFTFHGTSATPAHDYAFIRTSDGRYHVVWGSDWTSRETFGWQTFD